MREDLPERRVEDTRWPYGEQDAYGNSIANLRENLKLTPVERIRKAERFAKMVAKFQGVLHRTDRV
jgi:hypothetical protein